MIARMSGFQRKSGMTPEEFRQYWSDVHAPIAASIPGLTRYEQNPVLDEVALVPGLGAASGIEFDGLCQLHFPDEEAMKGVATPQMTRILKNDEDQFIRALQTMVIDPVAMKPAVSEEGTQKCLATVRRRNDLTEAEFRLAWEHTVGPLLAAVPGVLGYVQNHVVGRTVDRAPATYDQVPLDSIDEIWFDADRGMEAVLGSDAWVTVSETCREVAMELSGLLVRPNLVLGEELAQ